jgi:hypothetical protein
MSIQAAQRPDSIFKVTGNLKTMLDGLDDTNIMTRFAQTSDPIHLAFQHIDSKPFKTVAKEFAQDIADDLISFVSDIFK